MKTLSTRWIKTTVSIVHPSLIYCRCILWVLTGALKDDTGSGEAVTAKFVCGVGGVIGAGAACEECVEGGVCGCNGCW